MSNKAGSRGPTIDMDKCVEQAGGNRFELVLIAAQRAREISRQHKKSESSKHVGATVGALLEIQEGQVGRDYLNKV